MVIRKYMINIKNDTDETVASIILTDVNGIEPEVVINNNSYNKRGLNEVEKQWIKDFENFKLKASLVTLKTTYGTELIDLEDKIYNCCCGGLSEEEILKQFGCVAKPILEKINEKIKNKISNY